MAKNKFCTLWIALICIIVFIVQQIFSGFTQALVLNQNSFIQPWRFLTSIFLHGSVIHLLYNLFALVLFGLILEKIIGSRNFLIVFFSTGLIANLISVNFYDSSLGASGAILGIIGTLTVLRPNMIVWAFSLPLPLFVASILWAIGDLIGIFMPSNIGNIAHLSGLALGLIIGFLLREKYKNIKIYYKKAEIPESYMQDWENKFMR